MFPCDMPVVRLIPHNHRSTAVLKVPDDDGESSRYTSQFAWDFVVR